MDKKTQESVKKLLQKRDDISLGIVYGSTAEDRQHPQSDFDLAVAGPESLNTESKIELIEELVMITGRPVDLVDLRETHGTLLKQILTKGTLICKKDTTLYGNIISRMLFDDADFMPYYYRILKERREQWINN